MKDVIRQCLPLQAARMVRNPTHPLPTHGHHRFPTDRCRSGQRQTLDSLTLSRRCAHIRQKFRPHDPHRSESGPPVVITPGSPPRRCHCRTTTMTMTMTMMTMMTTTTPHTAPRRLPRTCTPLRHLPAPRCDWRRPQRRLRFCHSEAPQALRCFEARRVRHRNCFCRRHRHRRRPPGGGRRPSVLPHHNPEKTPFPRPFSPECGSIPHRRFPPRH
mmetsp:Transcript_5648/g.13990  ORF Transcript_5648/g.13990 Transcript_5648/m.13990 type:complete len:215 (-) Transcript_5648:784-1428(-)